MTNTVSTTARILHNCGLKMSPTLLREEAGGLINQAESIEQQATAIASNLSGIDEAIAAAQADLARAIKAAAAQTSQVKASTAAEAEALSRVQATQAEISRLQQQLVTETEAYATATGERLGASVLQSDEDLAVAAIQSELSELNLNKAKATSGVEVQINQLLVQASQLRTKAAAILAEAARVDAKQA